MNTEKIAERVASETLISGRVATETLISGRIAADVVAASEAEFWKLTKVLGWGTRSTDYKKMQKFILRTFTRKESDDLRDVFGKLKGKLALALNKWEREGNQLSVGGDDSYDDLQAHIIGMGKQQYSAVLKDPALANSIRYRESFAYVFPYSNDWDAMERGQAVLVERVSRYFEEYAKGKKDLEQKVSKAQSRIDSWDKNVKVLKKAEKLLKDGDMKGLSGMAQAVAAAEEELNMTGHGWRNAIGDALQYWS